MRQGQPFILFCLIILCLSSCDVRIIEIFFKKDDSGQFSIILDASHGKEVLEMIDEEGFEEFMKDLAPLDSIFHELDSMLNFYNAIEGISNSQFIRNDEKLHFGVKFDFESISSLNKGMESVLASGLPVKSSDIPFFIPGKKTLEKTSRPFFPDSGPGGFLPAQNPLMREMSQLIDKETYHQVILKFERKIKGFNNDSYHILNKNTLEWKKYINDQKKDSLDVVIRLK